VHASKQSFVLSLTYLQELIKESFPWLWEMKELISECPNIVPVGIGNNTSDIDMSGYANGFNCGISDESSQLTRTGDEMESELEEDDDDTPTDRGNIEPMEWGDANTGKCASGKSDTKKTGARPGKSNPAARSDSKKAKLIDRFSEVATAEEQTAQRQLELKRKRVESQSEATVAKIKAQAQIKLQKDKLRAKARREAKRQDHEFRMAQLSHQHQGFQVFNAGPSHHPSQTYGTGHHDSSLAASIPTSASYDGSSGPSRSHSLADDNPFINDFNFDPSLPNIN
jgi:hypothetical protein